MHKIVSIAASDARTLLLDAQGLLANPRRQADSSSLQELITQLGFVQIDSINVVERAHHLTLGSRLDGYTPSLLTRLLEDQQALFEHWTHDASAIPLEFYPHWKPRFSRYLQRAKRSSWWQTRLGPDQARTIRHVRRRIEREGPLQSRDFEHDRNGQSGAWWGWKPQKVALEHLWRSGELAIARRVNFQKVYDLAQRVFPDAHQQPEPHNREHIQWACSTAMERLVIATPTEIAAFWNAITAAEARQWCAAAVDTGLLVPVEVQPVDAAARPVAGYALHDWQQRLDAAPAPPRRVRLLCPFDPVIRDRKRLLRLFNFDYRFEAFVPAAKRVFGYYVMPLLENDRVIGRVDPKFHRDRDGGGELLIRRVFLETNVKDTARRREAIERAVARLAKRIGADRWTVGEFLCASDA